MDNVAMPNVDDDAKAWQEERSKRFGEAVAARRNALGLTAVEVSERTKAIGFPMTRSTIARIEGNHRAGKVDLAEVATLAAALNTAPVLLLFPDLVDGEVRIVPDRSMSNAAGLAWFTGRAVTPFPPGEEPGGGRPLDQLAFYEALSPLRLARRVVRHRRWVQQLAAQRAAGECDTRDVMAAVFELQDVKTEARRAGLIVVDDNDSVPVVSDDA